MKRTETFLISLLLMTLVFISNYSSAQGFLITKSGDTIQYTKIDESKFPNYKYWTTESEKPQKIKSSDISNKLPFPEYKLIMNEIDEFTGNLKKYTEIVTVGSTKRNENNYSINLVISLGKIVSSGKITYIIKLRTPNELGCTGSSKNYVMIKFNNGEVIKLDNDIAEIDCQRSAFSKYLLTDDVLNKLRYNEIQSIRFQKSEFYDDYYTIFPDCLIKTLEILDK
jgi:hypothetical protein